MKNEKTELDVTLLIGKNLDDINGFTYHVNSEGELTVSRNSGYSYSHAEDAQEDELIKNYITHINDGKGKIKKSTMFPLTNDQNPGLYFNFKLGGSELIYISQNQFNQLKEDYLVYMRDQTIDKVLEDYVS